MIAATTADRSDCLVPSRHWADPVPRHPFGFDRRAGLARHAGRATRRAGLERPLRAGLARRPGAADSWLWRGPPRAAGALHAAACIAASRAAPGAAGVSAAVRSE